MWLCQLSIDSILKIYANLIVTLFNETNGINARVDVLCFRETIDNSVTIRK